jgi:hypothetical protein
MCYVFANVWSRYTNGVRGDDLASEVINHFWMGHAWMGHTPETMSVTYSRLDWNSACILRKRSQWASVSPFRSTAPSCSKIPEESKVELVLQL